MLLSLLLLEAYCSVASPSIVPSELGDLAAVRETAIVLTAPGHERDAESLVERLGVPAYTPQPDSAQFLLGRSKDIPAR